MTQKQIERFWSKVHKSSSCWNWIGDVSGRGYGRFQINKSSRAAHRIAFLLSEQEIPHGMLIDHKCRNRLCVNPTHLRVVDNRTNSIENSNSVSAKHAAQTHCKSGHEFSAENTRIFVRKGTERRQCLVCQRRYERKYKAKLKALAGGEEVSKSKKPRKLCYGEHLLVAETGLWKFHIKEIAEGKLLCPNCEDTGSKCKCWAEREKDL